MHAALRHSAGSWPLRAWEAVGATLPMLLLSLAMAQHTRCKENTHGGETNIVALATGHNTAEGGGSERSRLSASFFTEGKADISIVVAPTDGTDAEVARVLNLSMRDGSAKPPAIAARSPLNS